MIALENLTKVFRLDGTAKTVADNITAVFPTGRSVGLLGRNGAGKSTLLQMIAGTISWPVGFAGSFHPDLTGIQNTRFVARIYGADTDELVHFVEDFAGLGVHFRLPVRTYSSGMRSRLAFGISMGIDFDTYLVDEITSVGDNAFRKKSEMVFAQRLEKVGAVIVSHSLGFVQRVCRHGAVLEDGRIDYYTDIDEAIRHHQEVVRYVPS